MVLTEQQRAEPVVVEAQGPGDDVGREGGNRFQAHALGSVAAAPRRRPGAGASGAPARLWAWQAVIRDLDQVAEHGAGCG